MLAAHAQKETTDERFGAPSAVPSKIAPDTDMGVDSASGDDMNAARHPQPEQRPRFAVPGQLIILTVALLWGTNPPALRYLYASDGTTFYEPQTDVTCAIVRRITMLYAHRLHIGSFSMVSKVT